MEDKPKEDFQKLILEIIKKQGEKIEKFITENKRAETPQLDIHPSPLEKEKKDFSIIYDAAISHRTLVSQEEMDRLSKEIGKEVGILMEKYKVSKLTAYTAKIYD